MVEKLLILWVVFQFHFTPAWVQILSNLSTAINHFSTMVMLKFYLFFYEEEKFMKQDTVK